MALLFVGSVMDLLWIEGLPVVTLLEETLSTASTARLAPVLGIGLAIWGAKLLTSA